MMKGVVALPGRTPRKRMVCDDSQTDGHARDPIGNRRVREKVSPPAGTYRGGGAGLAARQAGMGEAAGSSESCADGEPATLTTG